MTPTPCTQSLSFDLNRLGSVRHFAIRNHHTGYINFQLRKSNPISRLFANIDKKQTLITEQSCPLIGNSNSEYWESTRFQTGILTKSRKLERRSSPSIDDSVNGRIER